LKASRFRILTAVVLLGLIAHCRREGDRVPTPARLWKPKHGASYIDGLPEEIVWLKDGAQMVLVPGGEFLFGRANHKMTLGPFYIDKFPVTNERYRKFVRETGHRVPFMDQEGARS